MQTTLETESRAQQRPPRPTFLKPRPKISQETIQAISDAVSIVEFIGTILPLRKVGQEYSGPCPWHNSKSKASFRAYPIQKKYRCWSCNIGGDLIDFVSRYYGLNFRQAAEMLAREAGIDLDVPLDRKVVEAQQQRAELAAINAMLAAATQILLLNVRDQLHSAQRLRRNAVKRLAAIEGGSREKFVGEADAARESISLASSEIRKLDAAYLIVAFGSTSDKEQFTCEVETRDALVDQTLRRGFVVDDRGRYFEVFS